MNIAIALDDFDEYNVYFNKPIRNTVIDESNFLRITYSNEMFSMNGICINVTIDVSTKEKHYNKYKCSFNLARNYLVVHKLTQIEAKILKRIELDGKTPVKKIRQQLNCGNIKLFTDNSIISSANNYTLKMSGIWETDTEYGITYKFIEISNRLSKKTQE
jgi:hypothetical protein